MGDVTFTGNTLSVNSDVVEEETTSVSHHSCSYYLSILKLVSMHKILAQKSLCEIVIFFLCISLHNMYMLNTVT